MSPGRCTAMPSATVVTRSISTGRPAASEGVQDAQPAACTPITRMSGRSALIAMAMPESSPPPPSGTTTVSASRRLLEQLQADRALARDDRRVVERRHQHATLGIGARGRVALLERLAREHDLGAVVRGRDLLGERRVDGHVDARGHPERGRGERDALGVVAGARGDDAARALGVGQRGHAVDRAAQLEGAGALQVLGLEQHARARPARDRAGGEHGRRRDDAVDHGACALDVLEADHGGDGSAVGRQAAAGAAARRSDRPRSGVRPGCGRRTSSACMPARSGPATSAS